MSLMLLKQPEASSVLGIEQGLREHMMLEEEFSTRVLLPFLDNIYILLSLLMAQIFFVCFKLGISHLWGGEGYHKINISLS